MVSKFGSSAFQKCFRALGALCAFYLTTSPLQAATLHFGGQEYPPLNWTEKTGEVKGAMVDVAKQLCNKLHHTCIFELTTIARALISAQNGSVDGVLTLTPNAERNYLYFTRPIVKSKYVYMTLPQHAKNLRDLSDLSGWMIRIVRSSTAGKQAKEDAQKNPQINLVEDPYYETIIDKMIEYYKNPDASQHYPMAVIGDKLILQYYAQKAGVVLSPILEVEAPERGKQGYTFGFSKKSMDEKTFRLIEKTLDDMMEKGEILNLIAPYGFETPKSH